MIIHTNDTLVHNIKSAKTGVIEESITYTKLAQIGKGSCATCWKCRNMTTDELVAVKVIDKCSIRSRKRKVKFKCVSEPPWQRSRGARTYAEVSNKISNVRTRIFARQATPRRDHALAQQPDARKPTTYEKGESQGEASPEVYENKVTKETIDSLL